MYRKYEFKYSDVAARRPLYFGQQNGPQDMAGSVVS